MKHRKSIAIAAILSACALQIPLFAGNAASNTSSALAPFTPPAIPSSTPSLALVPWMPAQSHAFSSDAFSKDYEKSKAPLFMLVEPPHDFSSYLAYQDHKKTLNYLYKDYLRFVAQKYKAGAITKKRVKQAVKGPSQREVLNGTVLKK